MFQMTTQRHRYSLFSVSIYYLFHVFLGILSTTNTAFYCLHLLPVLFHFTTCTDI